MANIIIIGAGVAGMFAARELAPSNEITILEAKGRSGGRVRTVILDRGRGLVEGGAEFIHGSCPETVSLLKQAGIGYHLDEGKMYKKEDGAWKEQTDMIEGWDQLLAKMKKIPRDMSMKEFLDTYFPEDRHRHLREEAVRFVEG